MQRGAEAIEEEEEEHRIGREVVACLDMKVYLKRHVDEGDDEVEVVEDRPAKNRGQHGPCRKDEPEEAHE